MYHGLTIGGKHTWTDWRLIPTEPPFFPLPDYDRSTLTLPGTDFDLDVSLAQYGHLRYGYREKTVTFRVMSDYLTPDEQVASIADYVHGKYLSVVRDDDPHYTYRGRVSVGDVSASGAWPTVEIKFVLEPYRYGPRTIAQMAAGKTTITITNDGTVATPCAVTLSPINAVTEVTLTGIAYRPLTGEDCPITVRNLTKDDPVTLDGETCLITSGSGTNRFADVTLTEFPALIAGTNIISCNSDQVSLLVAYTPRRL